MNCIKQLHIEGFKRFNIFDMQFNEHMNIIVGENEAGKSTVFEAIKIVLNQQYRNTDKSTIRELFNIQMIEDFKKNSCVENLPYIYIELQMDISAQSKNAEYFYGEVNKKKTALYGISFECKFDEELGIGLENDILEGKIPYEYYSLRWTSFSGLPYYLVKKPFNFLAIDTSNIDANNSYNYYNRTLFNSLYDDSTRLGVKNSFREKLNSVLSEIELDSIDEMRKFGINEKKVVLESVLSVFENSIPLENKGRGMENLIKTQIALDKGKSKSDVILLEEPENHLCFTNMKKMLKEISDKQSESQIIITTHSNMIASRLNLNNVHWISENQAISLKIINENVACFFKKADDNNFLQLLLAKKIILVEGATEFLLLPQIYKQITKSDIEKDNIAIISCNGISYKRYLEIAKKTKKKIAVITDNDQNEDRIIKANEYNDENEIQHIFMGKNIKEWTWEACFYELNKDILDEIIEVQQGSNYYVHGKDYGKVLGKMLNNKVESAYKMLTEDKIFEIPEYVKEAIQWIKG